MRVSFIFRYYFQATHDEKFIEENIEYLDKEFQFWMANRTITVNVGGKMHTLARYNVEVDDPRPGQYFFPILNCVYPERQK
jgi:alpha,alpha-trehalase